jgi:hypothetical protein
MVASGRKKFQKIRVKLSKIQFPEICPVCLEEPEDLVFVSIMEKANYDYASSSWMKKQDRTEVALDSTRGAVSLAIPTCMLHGSQSVRSLRTKLVAALGFFVLFYPMLFNLLQINVALGYSRSPLEPVLGFFASFILLVILLIYGLFPRALERAIRFDDVSRTKDTVLLSISNTEYRDRFLDLNIIDSDIIDNKPTGNRG